MSFEAMQWAMRQRVRPATHKFVLVALADRADKASGLAWPSVAELSDTTGLDRKTVLSAIDQLSKGQFIVDTGDRKGQTGQVRVFRIPLETVPTMGPYIGPDGPRATSLSDTSIGTVSKSAENGTGTEIPVEESRFSHATVPLFPPNSTENGTRNQVSEPVLNQVAEPEERASVRRGCRIPPGFPTPDEIEWARSARPDLDPFVVAELFRNHWVAKPGKDATKLDWPATWHNWVRRERAIPGRGQSRQPSRLDRQADTIRALTSSNRGPETLDG